MAYVDGFLVPVPKDRIEDYKRLAALARQVWTDHGAIDYVESIADDVPYGQVTSFPRAVLQTEDEVVVFSWIVFPSREARDETNKKVMADPRFADSMNDMPFDGKRLIYGGFAPFIGL